MRGALLTVLSAGVFLQCLDSATLPPNPCPNLFQYQQDKNGDVFARVMLDNDYSGHYDISVNMSIAAYLVGEQNLEIEMESTLDDILAGCPLVYNISFPIQGVIPRLTRIELNNKVYCTGPSEELRPGGVTEMWAAYYYRTNQPPKRLSAKPKQKLNPRCTLLEQQPQLQNSTTISSNPWQQPSAAPTTFALSSSSTWKPPVTASKTNAPLTSWSWRPWSRRPSSTAPTTSASLFSNALWQPSNPCPNLFQYQQDKHGDAFGRIMLDNDYSGYYDISVNMSIAAYLVDEQKLKIEMESTFDDILAGCPLVYNISFPIQGVIPRLTRIELNKKVYCTGPSEKLRPGGVTEMWAAYHYRTNRPTKPLSARSKQKLQARCTLLTQQPPLHNSTTSPPEPSQQPSTASTMSTPLTSRTWPPYSTISSTPASSSSNAWQQPSAAPTTSTLLSSSTLEPPLTTSNTNAPLTSWTSRPWSWRPWSWGTSSTAPTTAASLSSSTWQSPSTVSTTDAPLTSRTWSRQPSSTAPTTSAPMSSEPSMHSPKPIQGLDWLTRPPSVAATTADSLIEEFSLSGKECGLTVVNTRASVIDGDDFVDGEFPWLVAIMYREKSDWDYKCTGSLVSNRHVITAGLCVKRKVVENFLLVFGTKNLRRWVLGAVQHELQSISVHPDYTDNKDDANVAILTVKTQITFEAHIQPVCLWHGEEYVNRMAGMQGTVVGWWMDGKRKFIDAKKIDLPIVSQTECLNSFSSMSSVISPRTFCAGLRGVGPCHGDSGAGFAMQRNGRWTLRGVVFTAVGDLDRCNDDIDNYFVFVDVDKVMSWLKKVMT